MKNNKTLETIISFINWLTSWTWVPSQIVISKTHDLKSHSLILLKKKRTLCFIIQNTLLPKDLEDDLT